jgi:hypothetical protein
MSNPTGDSAAFMMLSVHSVHRASLQSSDGDLKHLLLVLLCRKFLTNRL